MPGEDMYSWSVTAANNGTADTSINWAEGQARATVNNSARGMMAAHAKNRNLRNGTIGTGGTATAYTFTSGVGYTSMPANMRVMLRMHATNGASATLNMDSIGAYPIYRASTTLGLVLAEDMLAGGISEFIFINGNAWLLLNPSPGGEKVDIAGDTMTGALYMNGAPINIVGNNLNISGGGAISIDNSGSQSLVFTNVVGVRQWYSGTAADGYYRITDQTGGINAVAIAPANAAMTLAGPLSAAGTITTNLDVSVGRDLNVVLGTYTATLNVSSNATVSGTLNVAGIAGFAGTVYAGEFSTTGSFYAAGSIEAGAYVTAGINGRKPGGGTWIDISDARVKNVVGNYTNSLAAVTALQPVRFTYKGNDTMTADGPSPHQAVIGREFIGMIAQDAEPHMPEMVQQVSGYIDGAAVSDIRILDTTALTFALVNCVKELLARIEVLEAK